MPNDLLSYWKPATASNNIGRGNGLLEHSASNQYGRLSVGDTVWIVTVRNGNLYLLGRILVFQVMSKEEATRLIGSRNLWDAKYHIRCKPGTAQSIKEIPISHLATRLRFISLNGNLRLNLTQGKVNPQQLQTLRVLDPSIVALLKAAVEKDTSSRMPRKPLRRTAPKHAESSHKEKPLNAKPGNILVVLRQLQTAAKNNFESLIKQQYESVDRSEVDLNGLCYVLSECMHHLFPELKSYRIGWGDGTSHWFLRYPNGLILDVISENGECCDPDEYEGAKPRPFLTSWPSKRAVQLFALAGITNPMRKL